MTSIRAIVFLLEPLSSKTSGESFPNARGLGCCHGLRPEQGRMLQRDRLSRTPYLRSGTVPERRKARSLCHGSRREHIRVRQEVCAWSYSLEKTVPQSYMSDHRICPGRHFALRALFLNISCTLAVFDISAPTDEKPEAKYIEAGSVR